MLRNIGTTELIIIALILLILFGGRRLSDAGKGLQNFVKQFKKSTKGSAK